MKPRRGTLWVDLILVIVTALVMSAIHFQGWRARILNDLDMLPYYKGAFDLLHRLVFLDHGDLSSYSSYSPPGTVYLLLPGAHLFGDARLWALPAEVALYLGTLLLLYLTAREILGRPVALAATVVVAASRLGGETIYPVGHPIFVLAMLYLALRWVRDRAAWALGACLVVGAFGLYVDLAIAPFVLLVPVLVVLYRPPASARGLALAGTLSVLIWFPYLRFEMGRGFIDLRSILARRPASALQLVEASVPVYCFATGPGETDMQGDTYIPYLGGPGVPERIVYPEAGLRGQLTYHLCTILLNVDRGFDTDVVLSGGSRILNTLFWVCSLTAMVALAVGANGRRVKRWQPANRFFQLRFWQVAILALLGGIGLYLFLSSFGWLGPFVTHGFLQKGTVLVLGQLREFAPLFWIAAILGGYLSSGRVWDETATAVFAWALGLPWLLLVLLAEPGRPERFWWIWPLQALSVIVAFELLCHQLPMRVRWVGFAILCAVSTVLVFPWPVAQAQVADWRAHGYAGEDSGQMATVDYLGSVARQPNGPSAVGYDLKWPRVSTGSRVDPLLREGAWFDFLLEAREGVHNPNQTASGLSDQDIYRVLELSTGETAPTVPPWPGFRQAAGFGRFVLYERE